MDESSAPAVPTPPQQPAAEAKVVFNLTAAPNTVTIELPSMPQSRVTLRRDMTAEEAEKIALALPDGNVNPKQLHMMTSRATVSAMFVSWNLTDENGNDLPCTPEILQKFKFIDIMSMISAIEGNSMFDAEGRQLSSEEVKKKNLNV